MSSGWMFTDARQRVGCPRCGQTEGNRCRYPSGGYATYPHNERIAALRELPDYDVRDYQRKIT